MPQASDFLWKHKILSVVLHVSPNEEVFRGQQQQKITQWNSMEPKSTSTAASKNTHS